MYSAGTFLIEYSLLAGSDKKAPRELAPVSKRVREVLQKKQTEDAVLVFHYLRRALQPVCC